MKKSSFWNRVATVAALASLSLASQAQILIGQTVGVTGPVAATVKEAVEGARLYIDSINAMGGIRGKKIELITLDDKFDPKLAAANASTLSLEKYVVALFMNRGTPYADANANCLAVKRVFKFPELFNAYSLFYFRREVFEFFKIAR